MIVSAVSRKLNPLASEKTMDAKSSSARINIRTFNRKTAPTANPNMASEMATYPMTMIPSSIALDARGNPGSGGAAPLCRYKGKYFGYW